MESIGCATGAGCGFEIVEKNFAEICFSKKSPEIFSIFHPCPGSLLSEKMAYLFCVQSRCKLQYIIM
jgi:hypothetical protein